MLSKFCPQIGFFAFFPVSIFMLICGIAFGRPPVPIWMDFEVILNPFWIHLASFLPTWKTSFGYGSYCTGGTWGLPGSVPKAGQKASLKNRPQNHSNLRFWRILASKWDPFWSQFWHILRIWLEKNEAEIEA